MRNLKLLLGAVFSVIYLADPHSAFGKASAYLGRNDEWFAGNQAKTIAQNILTYQSALGGWPKNMDTTANRFAGKRDDLKPTFDNGATTDELRFLARIHAATKEPQYQTAYSNGLTYILKAQYPTGGWPQFYPPGTQYHRHITFNDSAMVRLLEFLRDVYSGKMNAIADDQQKKASRESFDRGITCILKCQVKVNGRLTAWCAQHDEINLEPRPGRTYELVSLSGSESVGIVKLLMSLDNPTPEIRQAIHAAVAWFESSKLEGIKVISVEDKSAPKGKNKVVVKDKAAPPLWARFYEIESNRPLFVDRDGIPKYDLSEIGYERRNGYAWYGDWPQKLIAQEYPAWKTFFVREVF